MYERFVIMLQTIKFRLYSAGILYIYINASPEWVAKEKLAIQIRKSPEYICVEIHNFLK